MKYTHIPYWVAVLALLLFLLVGCGDATEPTATPTEPATAVAEPSDEPHEGEEADHEHEGEEADHEHEGEEADHDHDHDHDAELLALPDVTALNLDGRLLNVVATTSIIGDIVSQVGGEQIALTTLIQAGQDPHSYEPTARDLTAVANADVLFVNGWDLEEALAHDLEEIGHDVAIVPISAYIVPADFDEHDHDHEHEGEEAEHQEATDDHHHHHGVDPHVWWSIDNVKQWVENVEHVLSELDPAHADEYAANAAAYVAELDELAAYAEAEIAKIPAENRYLITNHESFNYFAQAYDFVVLGSVLPSFSTLAEPSANDLVNLINEMKEHGVCTIFTETIVSTTLANTVAGELSNCESVQIASLYSDMLGEAGSDGATYIDAFRANVQTIVEALR